MEVNNLTKIRPITYLRNTKEISNLCKETSEPIYITNNGEEDMVIMSVETYEREQMLMDIYRKLGEAEKEIREGKLLDGKEVFKKLKDKYGY